jgi:amidohydrolase
MNTQELLEKIQSIKDWVIQQRRFFHRHPELGMEEYRTSETISALLMELEIPCHTGVAGTGIVGLIKGNRPGRTIALRADMDALPITEATGLEYASVEVGRMHACGHDAHMAILLGVAKILNGMKDELSGNVKLLFQPAEETDGGARPMIKAGCMETPHVDYVLGLHVTPYVDTGKILIKSGTLTASSDIFRITVYGRSSHAAYPEDGVDAILLGAHVVTALQTIVSRNTSPLDSCVITVGKIQGGTKENIISDQVNLSGTMRTIDSKTRALIKDRIVALSTGVCDALGGRCSVEFEEGYMPIINNDEVTSLIIRNAQQLLGATNVLAKDHPSMGVEDFSFFCDVAPGAFYYLGCGDPGQKERVPAHSPHFLLDERCLTTGILLQTVNTLTLLGAY